MLKTCSGHVSLHMLYSNNWVFTSKVAWGKRVCIIHVETQGNCQALEIREFSIFYTEFPLVAYDNFLIRHWVSFRTFSCIVKPFFHYYKRPLIFTVMDGSDADGDLVLIQTFLLYYVNQVILISGQRESCLIARL